MLNPSQSIDRPHPSNESIENYCMGRMAGRSLDSLEEHVFQCHVCQVRLTETDNFVLAMRGAGAKMRAIQAKSPIDKARSAFNRNVFVSHGGPAFCHVQAISELLSTLGFESIVVQQQPALGSSVYDKVTRWMRICRSAIVLATADDGSAAGSRTRPNVEHEIGMLQTMPTIRNRIVYLKEPGVQFPSNFAEKVWIDFTRDRIQDAFIPVIRELR